MPCRECQHIIRHATMQIFNTLKPCREGEVLDDQAWMIVLVMLRRIEKQVASKTGGV